MTRWERLVGLLLLLQSSAPAGANAEPWLTAGQAAEHFGVSRRTVLRDIAALGTLGVPILSRDGVRGGYALAPEYAPPALPLTLRETLLLLLALSGIEKLAAAPFGNARETLVAKLRAMIAPSLLTGADALLARVALDIPDRSHLPSAAYLDEMLIAAQAGRWIAATYRSTPGVSTYVLQPERISVVNGVWYCEATACKEGVDGPPERRTFRLDRFQSAEPLAGPPAAARQPRPKSPLPYDDPSHPEVVVRLTARGVRRAEMEHHLGRTVIREPDGGGGAMRFRCPPSELEWAARYFFGFGVEAEVLAPESLRTAIREIATATAAQYAED